MDVCRRIVVAVQATVGLKLFLLTGHKLNMVRSPPVNTTSDDWAGVAGLRYIDSAAKHRAPCVRCDENYCSSNVQFDLSAVSATMVSVKSNDVHGSLFQQHQLWQLRLVAAVYQRYRKTLALDYFRKLFQQKEILPLDDEFVNSILHIWDIDKFVKSVESKWEAEFAQLPSFVQKEEKQEDLKRLWFSCTWPKIVTDFKKTSLLATQCLECNYLNGHSS